MEYEWGTDARHLAAGRKGNGAGNASPARGAGYGVVVCADCVYAGTSVEPLLASLCEVGYVIFSRKRVCFFEHQHGWRAGLAWLNKGWL